MEGSRFKRRASRLFRSPTLYAQWLVTGLLTLVGVVSNVYGLFPLFANKEVIFLSASLVAFGAFNVGLMSGLSAYKIRHKRAQRAYAIIHDIAEEARNLRDDKTSKEKCGRAINAICFQHLETLLRDFLGYVPNITLKYFHGEHLHSLRSRNQSGRATEPEPVKKNEVFEKLVKHMDKFKAIYVRDVHDERELCLTFGVDVDRLRQRAEGKYRTFIALPIRWSQYQDGQLPMKGTIGMLGIDDLRPGALEDLEEEDFQALYAIVDILSECVVYLIKCQGVGHGN